jgi:hypothetical protein
MKGYLSGNLQLDGRIILKLFLKIGLEYVHCIRLDQDMGKYLGTLDMSSKHSVPQNYFQRRSC